MSALAECLILTGMTLVFVSTCMAIDYQVGRAVVLLAAGAVFMLSGVGIVWMEAIR